MQTRAWVAGQLSRVFLAVRAQSLETANRFRDVLKSRVAVRQLPITSDRSDPPMAGKSRAPAFQEQQGLIVVLAHFPEFQHQGTSATQAMPILDLYLLARRRERVLLLLYSKPAL